MGNYDLLLEEGRIGSLRTKNRMICTAMVTQYCTEDGMPTEQYIRYHEEKARGGWGLQITEDYAIVAAGKTFARLPGLWCDEQIAAHAEFVRRVHCAGGCIAAQIFHPGRETSSAITGVAPVAPSAVREPTMPEVPRELSRGEIAELVADFASAASRVVRCGFDAVELHGAHGYLLGQFMSPASNKRSDEYGGTLRNRARFAVEVVEAVRAAVGPDFPIIYRLNVDDCVEGGMTPREAAAAARLLEAAGVDLLNCSQGVYASVDCVIPPASTPRAAFADNAAIVKRAVRIPVACVGRINDPDVAEGLLLTGACDFIAMGRASLADPHFPQKVAEGRCGDIIQCVGCCRGCSGQNNRGECVSCVLNPLTGREGSYDISRVERPKKVVVVGGGIAGCEAAIAAAARGHDVTVLEREPKLGGQWNLATVPPGKQDYGSFVAWQAQRLRALGVDVRLGFEASAEAVSRFGADVVVVATGSASLRPPIPGLADSASLVDARDILSGAAVVSGRVAVLGGGLVGAEVAALLAEAACEVSVIEMRDELAPDAEPSPRKHLLGFLRRFGVREMLGCRVCEVGDDYVAVDRGGEAIRIEGLDAIVCAFGATPRTALAEQLRALGENPVVVGDARAARDAFSDVREGFEAGIAIG